MHKIQNENLRHVLPFHDCGFSGDAFYYNLNSLSKNASANNLDVFKKRGMRVIHINITSLLTKIDEMRYFTNIINVSTVAISDLS